jgi:outer membrane lipoprotein SlyB
MTPLESQCVDRQVLNSLKLVYIWLIFDRRWLPMIRTSIHFVTSGKQECGLLCIALLAAAGMSGCASQPKQPVLYPNNHLQTVGEQTAQQDITDCMQFARASSVNENKDAEVGRKAAGGAAVGGASAAAWGVVRGGDVGNRALAGAAAGATAGAVHGGLQSTETSPLFMNFVNKCLSDKGYSVIGWQ